VEPPPGSPPAFLPGGGSCYVANCSSHRFCPLPAGGRGRSDPGANPPGTGSPTTGVRAKSLLGTTVTLQGGTRAGTIEDIVLSNDGVVDYLIVSEGGKLVTVPWDAVNFNYQKRTATINLAPEQYRRIPTYTTTEYPQY